MKRALLISFLTAAMILTISVAAGLSRDSGVVKETRELTGFDRIGFGVAGDLYINIGSEFKVELEGEKSLLEEIKTVLSGSKLVIKKDTWYSHTNEKVTIYITLPALKELGVSGSGKAEIRDAVKADDLDFSVSGSGRIQAGDLEVGNFDVAISGSGDVIINGGGEVKGADVGISGSGNFTAEDLRIADADMSISGSGSCRCYVTDNLEAHVSGSGNVIYSGNPKIDARVSGSGRVRSK
jgi:hypothetical protein